MGNWKPYHRAMETETIPASYSQLLEACRVYQKRTTSHTNGIVLNTPIIKITPSVAQDGVVDSDSLPRGRIFLCKIPSLSTTERKRSMHHF